MRILWKLQLTAVVFLVITGAVIVVGDMLFIHRYGVDYNEAAFVTRTGETADWPTGERPLYAYFPAWGYGLAAWILAVTVLVFRGETREPDRIAGWRGTE